MKSSTFYLLSFILLSACTLSPAQQDPPAARDAFLDMVQYRSFLYFWELSNPDNGLTPDRAPTPSFCSIAAVGFALSSYVVGVERGYITRDEARERVVATLQFFLHAPQGIEATRCSGYRGFFYHFLDLQTGLRYENVELSTIDTTLLLAGILTCQSYFDRDNSGEKEIRELADIIYRRMDWRWFQARQPLVCMGWHPESGFIPFDWQGYNEAMLLYILALASPTFPVAQEAWQEWTRTYLWGTFCGETHANFSPLFGHQYSHIWINFRGIQDSYMREKGGDYFDNSRRAVYANRAYCLKNPGHWQGYGEHVWGLTACDGPGDCEVEINGEKRTFHGYWARGASLGEICDDGTIAPTAAGGAIPFAPEICIPALKEMYRSYGTRLFGRYGFYDAFNPTYRLGKQNKDGWFASDHLGIDNGPIVLMIENHYTGLIWQLMQKNPYIIAGLKKAGFHGGWLNK